MEEATDDSVKKWFEERLASAPRDLSERVRSAVESVKFEQCRKDPYGAGLRYVLNVVGALDKNNASEVVNDKEMCKSLNNKLIVKLEPPELRERIRDNKECWTSEQKADLSFFQTRVTEVAVDVMQGEIARDRLKRKKETKKRGHVGNFKELEYNRRSKRQKSNFTNKRRGGTRERWEKPCLNPDCKERHKIRDCKFTSEERKKELLQEYYKNRKAQVKSVKLADMQNTQTPSAEDGRYKVILEDVVSATALGDYGSDQCAMPNSLLKEVIQADSTVPVEILEEPLQLEAAVKGTKDNPILFSASKTATLSLTIMLPGSNIPVRIRGVKFYIVDQEMGEVLIGRPFLKAIGFNLNDHLSEVSSYVNGRDIRDISPPKVKICAARYNGLVYQGVSDDPIELSEALSAGIGTDKDEDINLAFACIVSEAVKEGITDSGKLRLEKFLREFRDVFRIKLSADPPARLRPLVITRKQDSLSYRCPQRRYAPVQRAFISSTIKELEAVGAIFKNPAARWASPALAVPKPGSTHLRFTVDLRKPNSQTVPIQSAMPHLESMLQSKQGSNCFAKIDMAHAYCQLPLAPQSQEMLSIQTPIGVFTSRRLLQGSTDAGNHFQAVTQEAFQNRDDKMLQWIDDFLLHAPNENVLLDSIHEFLKVCREYGFKIHAEKTHFFLRKATFCGRAISSDGIQFEPLHPNALLKMETPRMGNELQQFLCATNWMRTSIPEYAKVIAPLHRLMEDVYKKTKSRTKRSVAKIHLNSLWGEDHDAAFSAIIQQLAVATKLAQPKPDHNLCLFTDASSEHWAAIFTQVSKQHKRMPIQDQPHEPVCFLSGSFTGASANWSVPEKEGFAIVEALCRLDYMVSGREVSIYTDHANLVYLFDPQGNNPGIPRHTASKLMRWALKISSFRNVIQHLAGNQNVWADMLTRWAAKPRNEVKAKRVPGIKSLLIAPVSPAMDEMLEWQKMADIRAAQGKSAFKPKKGFFKKEGIWQNKIGIV